MAFLPNTTIYLCEVPFDSTQKNQVLFNNAEEQRDYFLNRQRELLISYNIVRKTQPDGSMVSSVRVANRIDDLRAKCVNYMMYQNAQHGAKWFYCFIEKLIYVSESCTEIVFRTDVFQTWLFEANIRDSYVVREHSVTDEIGEHIVPEEFNCGEFEFLEMLEGTEITGSNLLNDYCFLMCSSECLSGYTGEGSFTGFEIEGVPQGLYFYVCMDYKEINTVTSAHSDVDEGWLQCIVAIPKFCLKNACISGHDAANVKMPDDETVIGGMLYDFYGSEDAKSRMAKKEIPITFDKNKVGFNGYKPKNNKLYTSPYFSICVTNQTGQMQDYALENFSNIENIKFKLIGDISTNPTLSLIPCNFLGVGENYNYPSTLNDFPQISHTSDSYKLWLAKNQGTIALETVGNLLNIGTGLATLPTGVSGAQAVAGAQGIMNTINSVYQASRMPNKVTPGGGKNTLLLMTKQMRFRYFWKRIKRDMAESIDDFFTMYGYQVNKVKTPNRNARKSFTYVQTIDINIDGGIPCDDLRELKDIYNNGVTIWQPDVFMGNYDVDNSPR